LAGSLYNYLKWKPFTAKGYALTKSSGMSLCQKSVKRNLAVISLTCSLLFACNFPSATQVIMTTAPQTETSIVWTDTPSPSQTFTMTYTITPTFTPISTATITPTPTLAFPRVTVNVANLACLFGPAKPYLWARDLQQGDQGSVWGRAPVGDWIYVKMDKLDIPCWVHPFYLDVEGDIGTMAVQSVQLPITNALYGPPQNVRAVRDEDQVTVTWDEVHMTQDDDRGYFLDVWVCQDGNFVWMPVGRLELPDQYHNSYVFTDQPGCSQPSGGQIYTVEKHGYTSPMDIPWPSN
jgi:hypothetical protein